MINRLFLDESGDHTTSNEHSVGKRYLGIVSVILSSEPYGIFKDHLSEFKVKHFGAAGAAIVLHREDIINKRGPFSILREDRKRREFDEDLQRLISVTPFRVIAIVLDKRTHAAKGYRTLTHSYHYCLQALVERYVQLLSGVGSRGDVMAESRGGTEDGALKQAYRDIFNHGTRFLPKDKAQATLTSREIKIKNKQENEPGLQLADLLAHSMTRDVLLAYNRISSRGSAFAEKMSSVVQDKYHCNRYTGKINGYGRVLLE